MNDLPLIVWSIGMGVVAVITVGVAIHAAALGRVRASERLDGGEWFTYAAVAGLVAMLWPIVIPCALIYWTWRMAVAAVERRIRRKAAS
jgi:hypothetical protein